MVSLNPDHCIYVGNLPGDVSNNDLKKLFKRYGNITSIDLKINQPGPPYAFIEYSDCLDAEDAIRKRDGYQFYGHKLRVAYTNRGPDRSLLRNPSKRERHAAAAQGGSAPQRSKYRVYVSGLPLSACWQDLKNHMQESGKVCYTDVSKDGNGVVEYFKSRHMKYALRKMDDTKFRSHSGETSYIRVHKRRCSGKTRSGSRKRRSSSGGHGRRKKSHSRSSRSRSSSSRSSSSCSSSTSDDDR